LGFFFVIKTRGTVLLTFSTKGIGGRCRMALNLFFDRIEKGAGMDACRACRGNRVSRKEEERSQTSKTKGRIATFWRSKNVFNFLSRKGGGRRTKERRGKEKSGFPLVRREKRRFPEHKKKGGI